MKIEDLIDILYDDGHILVVNKESGLLTHKTQLSSERDLLVDRLRTKFPNPPSPVHRLDRPTSGLIICSYTPEISRILGKSFLQGKVEKHYLAIVRGYVDDSGEIDIPLKKDGEGDFQEAKTYYTSLKRLELPIKNNKYNS